MAKKTDKSSPKTTKTETSANASRDEQIGFHKGSLMTLSKERQELVRIIGIVEQLMQMHAASLQELGVKLDAQTGASPQPAQAAPKKRPPIEDIL